MNTRTQNTPSLKTLTCTVLLSALLGTASAATPIFSDNFDTTDGLGTTLSARGWTDYSDVWSQDIVSYLDKDAALVGANTSTQGTNAMDGPAHAVSGITFGSGESYLVSAQVSTGTTSTLYGGNRFLVGLSSDLGDERTGIFASISQPSEGSGALINIRTGNPKTLNSTTEVASSVLVSWSAETYYTITLQLSATTVVASVYDGNSLLGSTSYTLDTELSGTPFSQVQLGARNGTPASGGVNQPLDYFTNVSVTAIPEPTTMNLLGVALLMLVAGKIIRRRATQAHPGASR